MEKREVNFWVMCALIAGVIFGYFSIPMFSELPGFVTGNIAFALSDDKKDFRESIEYCGDIADFRNKFECVETVISGNCKITKPHTQATKQDADYTFNNGGVCHDYAEMWRVAAEEFGERTEITHLTTKGVDHEYANIYSDNEEINYYCIADGCNLVACVQYGGGLVNETEYREEVKEND